jgi:hypothetical protein
MSGAQNPLALIFPGPVVAQGKLIQERLKLAFPANKFQHKFLPPRIDKAAWKDLTTSGQPFIGLGFQKISAQKIESRQFAGIAHWIALVAVRAAGRPDERYYGDAQGLGVLTLAPILVAMLQGWFSNTGTATVDGMANVASDEWADDSSIVQVSFSIPITLALPDLIANPGGAGVFAEMAETWVLGGVTGVTTTYLSDWENPDAASS